MQHINQLDFWSTDWSLLGHNGQSKHIPSLPWISRASRTILSECVSKLAALVDPSTPLAGCSLNIEEVEILELTHPMKDETTGDAQTLGGLGRDGPYLGTEVDDWNSSTSWETPRNSCSRREVHPQVAGV